MLVNTVWSVWFGFFSFQVESEATKSLKDAVSKYDVKDQPGAKDLLDWAQQRFECCGVDGASDYKNATCKKGGVPTCYSNKSCNGTLYDDGCKEKFISFVRHNLAVVGAVAIGIAFIQVSLSNFSLNLWNFQIVALIC